MNFFTSFSKSINDFFGGQISVDGIIIFVLAVVILFLWNYFRNINIMLFGQDVLKKKNKGGIR